MHATMTDPSIDVLGEQIPSLPTFYDFMIELPRTAAWNADDCVARGATFLGDYVSEDWRDRVRRHPNYPLLDVMRSSFCPLALATGWSFYAAETRFDLTVIRTIELGFRIPYATSWEQRANNAWALNGAWRHALVE